MAQQASAKTVIKAGIWYTIANFLTKGAVFLTTPFFTRLMTQSDIGAYANMNSWFFLLVSVVTFDLSVSLGIARFDFKDELNEFTSSILFYGVCITAFCYGLVLLNMDFFCSLFSMQPYAVHVIFIYMFVYPALQTFQGRNGFEFRYRMSTFISLSSLLISVGLSLLLTVLMENKLLGRTIGYYLPLIAISLALFIYQMARGKTVRSKYLKYAVKISFPMIWHTLAGQLLSAGDRIVITHVQGEAANALYSVVYTCSMVAYVLWISMNSAWSPWSTERMAHGETALLRKVSRPYTLFYVAVVILMLLVAPELLWIMGGVEYMQARAALAPIIIGCVCQFVYSLYVNVEFYLKKQKRIAFGTMMAALLNLGLNMLLVPHFGYVAAAYTTLVGYLSMFLFHYLSVRSLGKADWYDTRFNWLVIGGCMLLIPLMNWLYDHTILRYSIFALLVISACTAMWKYRAMIIKFIKKR